MSKNLFRKGLVAAALTGLLTSAIAAAPAHAAGEIVVAPKAGTSYNTFADQTYSLVTSFAPGVVVPNVAQLKYKLTRAAGKAVYAYAGTNSAGTPSAQTWTSDATVINASASLTAVNYLKLNVNAALPTDATNSVNVTAWVDSNNNDVVDAAEWQAAQTVTFKKYSEVTATTALTAGIVGDTTATAKVSFDGINNEQLTDSLVQAAFTKGDGSALIANATPSVTAAASDANSVVTFTATNSFVTGNTVTVSGSTNNSGALNGTYTVVSSNGTSFKATAVSATVVATTTYTLAGTVIVTGQNASAVAAWSATDFFKSNPTVPALQASEAVKVQPVFNSVAVGAAVTTLNVARSVSEIDAAAVASNSTTAGTTAVKSSSATTAGTGTVSLNKSFQVYAKTLDTATTPAAVAGKTVSYTVTATKLPATAATVTSSTATLTINGVTYTNQAALPGATGVAALTGVTGTDGKVSIAGSTTGYAIASNATDDVVFNFTVENFTIGLTITEQAAVASKAYITNYEGNAAAVASGTAVALNIAAVDQFGAPIADGYDVRAIWASSSRSTTSTTNATAAVIAAVVSGKATLNLPDAGAGTGTNVWSVDIIKRDPTTGTYGSNNPSAIANSLSFGSGNHTTFTVNFKAAADLVAGKIALSDSAVSPAALALNSDSTKYVYTAGVLGGASNLADLSTATFGAYDARNVLGTVPAPAVTGVVVNGVVSSASTATYAGVVIPGTTVTIAGAGLQFQATQGGAAVWATDSITLNADNAGAFSVTVYSHKAGAQTVTITSGAAKSVVDLNYKAAAADKGVTPVITAPATVVPGSTFSVSALFADKFGNAVYSGGTAWSNANPPVASGVTGYMTATAATQATFKLSVSTGVGSTFADLTATGTDGVAKGNITTGSGDNGTITVTATYDADGAGTTYAAVTATATVKVAAPAAAKNTVAVAASQAQVGAAVDVTATAVDAAGKPAAGVVVSFTVAGQGYLSTASATTNAAGVATVKLVSNVAGMNTVSAAANGVATAATAAVTFGNADANITFNSNKRRATATYEFAGNAKVVISVNGVRVKTLYPADDMVGSYSVSLKKGKNKVSVSVAGVTTDSHTVTTK